MGSPRHPQSNGFIERKIRYIKLVKKCQKSGDIDLALLNMRASSIDGVISSPTELMFGRPISTVLPSRREILAPELHRERIQRAVEKEKVRANQRTAELRPLMEGQHVRVLDHTMKQWLPANIVARTGQLIYILDTEGGNRIRRNRTDLRPTPPTKPATTPVCDAATGPAPQVQAVPESTNTVPVRPTTTGSTSLGTERMETPIKTRSGRLVRPPDRYNV